MDPVSIGVIGASVLGGLGAASWTGLKAWHGWLELKRLELTHGCAERTMPPAMWALHPPDPIPCA